MSLLQKSCFVIPEVVIGNPVPLKNKDFWIPVFTGMTAQVILQGLLQEPHMSFSINLTPVYLFKIYLAGLNKRLCLFLQFKAKGITHFCLRLNPVKNFIVHIPALFFFPESLN